MTNENRSSNAWPWQYWRKRALQSLATILLSLFLPLSFLLLLRVSAARSHLLFSDLDSAGSEDLLASLFLRANSILLYALLSLITLSAFVHSLTRGRLSLIQRLLLSTHPQQQLPAAFDDWQRPGPRGGRSLSLAWLLLCTSLVFVELGIEFQLNGTDPLSDHQGRRKDSLLTSIRGVLFAVGLYETMLYWSKSVVKPVVEDTVMTMMEFTVSSTNKEGEIKIRWVDRVGLGLSFGALWWWRLRDHVESLVVTAAADNQVADLGLYYSTGCIGVIRALTGVMWVGTAMT